MVKNKLNLIVVINLLLIGLLIVFFIWKTFESGNKNVYVDNNVLFDGFIMTKEMKRFGEKEFNARKMSLDSIYSKLQSQTILEADKKIMMQQFIHEKEDLEKFNQNFGREESSKIWVRIHSYVKEYSKEHNYQLVIGSQNQQTVLYADQSIDVTKELLSYINKKYEGLE